ncbi:hypothetical protein AB1N83_001349 [Pleurotus pulmonarius]
MQTIERFYPSCRSLAAGFYLASQSRSSDNPNDYAWYIDVRAHILYAFIRTIVSEASRLYRLFSSEDSLSTDIVRAYMILSHRQDLRADDLQRLASSATVLANGGQISFKCTNTSVLAGIMGSVTRYSLASNYGGGLEKPCDDGEQMQSGHTILVLSLQKSDRSQIASAGKVQFTTLKLSSSSFFGKCSCLRL